MIAHCHCLDELTIDDDGLGSVLALVGPWFVLGVLAWLWIFHALFKIWRDQ